MLVCSIPSVFSLIVPETLLKNYEKEVFPNSSGITMISHNLSSTSFSDVKDINLIYKQIIIEYF